MANASNDFWAWLTNPTQNTIANVGGTPITTPGNSPLSSFATTGLDIWSLLSGDDRKNTNEAVNIADPLYPLQQGARQQMSDFLTDPSSVLKDPAFLAAEKLGAENISRQAGAKDMASSGNRLADLFSFGQTAGLGYEQQRFQQLLSILQGSAPAADIFTKGRGGQNSTIADIIAQLTGGGGVGGLINQLPQLFKLIGGGGGGGVGGMIPGADPGIPEIPSAPDFPSMDPWQPPDVGGGFDIPDFGLNF